MVGACQSRVARASLYVASLLKFPPRAALNLAAPRPAPSSSVDGSLAYAGPLLGIDMRDHVIVGEGRCLAFRDVVGFVPLSPNPLSVARRATNTRGRGRCRPIDWGSGYPISAAVGTFYGRGHNGLCRVWIRELFEVQRFDAIVRLAPQ